MTYNDGGADTTEFANSSFDAFLMANPVTSSLQGGVQALTQAVAFVKNLESQIEVLFEIGAGRREADLITPYENQLGAPGGILNTAQLLALDPAHDNARDLNEIYQLTYQACQAFYRYIDAPLFNNRERWPDGRASRQAYANMKPIADSILQALKNQLIAAGGVLTPIANYSPGGTIGTQLGNKLSQLGSLGMDAAAGSRLSIGGSGSLFLILAVVAVALFAMKGKA